MIKREETLQKIVTYFQTEESVKMLVQEGSFAKKEYIDEWSDLDINVWFEGKHDFSKNLTWLEKIGRPLVTVPLDFPAQEGMRSLIVIFDNGVKVDFSFWPLRLLESPFPYYKKYLVLLDKKELGGKLISFLQQDEQERLDEKGFQALVDEFYLEMHYVAKFSKRGDFWFVGQLKAGIRENYFLPLLEEIAYLYGKKPHFLGRRMADWLPSVWLNKIQLLFQKNDLEEVFDLFSELAQEICVKRGFSLDEKRLTELKKVIVSV
ncbi:MULTISPECIES: aminoglycoside 6-adenylyltransferase [Listeria]|uniref:aminoglycoside 6-adenylyltransferase n=1 Tax=Listeria TaxID=1637 RepID=UPI000B59125A|nr:MULTISPECIES: aminoglycoside 6-adenylyltransferase [Listeria]